MITPAATSLIRSPKWSLWCILFLTLNAGLALADGTGTDSFDTATPGALPAGWAARIVGDGEPKWAIAGDDSAPSAPFVLKQSGWSPNPSFPICVRTNTSLKDGFVEVKFKPLSGTNDQAAGLVWRYRDEGNYYVARANALENNVVLYKVEQGKRKALDIVGRKGGYGVSSPVSKLQWSSLRVEFAGQRFQVRLNGAELFAVEDGSFAEAGAVGVWTKADSVILFDDFACGR